ncbi:unnamed protein product [Paramecium sonneborni]|uniref:Uncharacterized protein n=1 Tax=Paramecium sonneborni TaxID=65129 RepID=A0A8S1K5M3_9CILI|nr:unnamed protein product [Paramecium sonneborni]
MKESKKQLIINLEAIELQNLLRDQDPEQLATQEEVLIEQNKKLQEKVIKFKLIAKLSQEQRQSLQKFLIQILKQQ